METDEPVSVYTVNNPYEAEVIKMALLSEGIACRLGGEATVHAEPIAVSV